jgi:lactoylglutathione lyase
MDLQISHIQHTGIPVTDLDHSVAFYERLGFQQVMASAFAHKGEMGKVAMMQQREIIIELYQLPEVELLEIAARDHGHIDHIAFDVQDIDKAYAELTLNGFTILEDEPVFLSFWKNGCKYFNITGPDGERLEFNQIL